MQVSKSLSSVPPSDPLWKWIEDASHFTTSQNVPLRKSFFSLTFPVHPKVSEHFRFLANFLSTEHDTKGLADLLLATAWRYRSLPSITNSTTKRVMKNRMAHELLGKPGMGRIILGHDQQTAGILIDAVDDTGTAHTANPRQAVPAMREQCVDKGAVVVSRGRVDDQARRLIKDQ